MSKMIHNFFDSASGRITDPMAFMAADSAVKREVIKLWAARDAQTALSFRDKADAFFNDAQVGMAFLTPQLYRIETEVYMTRYPSFDISQFMTVDSSGDMWDAGTLVYSMDQVGEAQFLSAGAFDVPYVSTKMAQATRPFHLAAIGYEWNTQEMQRAAMLGRALGSDKAGAAVLAADRFIYGIAMTGANPAGVSEKGWTGFVNDGNVPAVQVANDGTGPSRLWSAKTADQILRDINACINAVEMNSAETFMADTLILPTTAYDFIASTPRATGSDMTILSFLQQANVVGAGLKIGKSRALESAGTGNGRRMVAYANIPQVIKFHLPGPHRFLPPFQKSSLTYEVAGIMNVGGTEIRVPKGMSYYDSF